jgi:hypothetical protein
MPPPISPRRSTNAVLQAARAAQALSIELAVCALAQQVFDMSGPRRVLRIYGELPC